MKKALILIPILLLTALIYYGCEQQITGPEDTFINTRLYDGINQQHYPLYAGQDILVGEVLVWEEGDFLKVKFVIDENLQGIWCIEDTKVAIATSLDGIPQTSKHNPIPGQFPYKHPGLNCVTEDLFSIPLSEIGTGAECGQHLFIATHANVKKLVCDDANGIVYGMQRSTGDVYLIDVPSGTASLSFSSVAPNPTNISPNGLAYDGVNLRMYYADYRTGTNPRPLYMWSYGATPPTETQVGTLAIGVENAAADFYSGKYYYIASYPGTDDLYEVTFDTDGMVVPGGNVKIADLAANVHGWTFDGDIAIKDGVLYGWGKCNIHNTYEFFTYNLTTTAFNLVDVTTEFSLQLAFGENGILYGHAAVLQSGNYYWYTVNVINGTISNQKVVTPNNGYTDCSSGMICELNTETAWGGTSGFDGKNWATYFEYDLTPCCNEWIVYGSELGSADKLYQVDLKAKTSGVIYDPGSIEGQENYPNGNAYDPVNQRLYFGTSTGVLYYYDFVSNVHQPVTTGLGNIASGCWYNGEYYWVKNGSNQLWKLNGTTATLVGTVPTLSLIHI